VQRAISQHDGRIETPKSGHRRYVDLSDALAVAQRRVRMLRAERMKRYRWKTLPPWSFCTRTGEPLDAHNVRKVFRKCVKAAKLPKHFTLKEQLGHASITLTVDTYGKWFAMKPVRGGVNILGDVVG